MLYTRSCFWWIFSFVSFITQTLVLLFTGCSWCLVWIVGLLNSPLAATTSDILEELFMKPLPKVSFRRSKNALKGKLEHVTESRKSWLFLNPKFTYSYLKAFVLYYSHCHFRNYAWILLWIQAAVLVKQSFYDMTNKQTNFHLNYKFPKPASQWDPTWLSSNTSVIKQNYYCSGDKPSQLCRKCGNRIFIILISRHHLIMERIL